MVFEGLVPGMEHGDYERRLRLESRRLAGPIYSIRFPLGSGFLIPPKDTDISRTGQQKAL